MVVMFSTQTTVNTTQALIEVWETLEPKSCPHHYNFHLHTLFSDGRLTPEELIQQAVNIGLKGLAITDHHSVEGYYRAQSRLEYLRYEQPEAVLPTLWTGIEITSDLWGTRVHILGYGFNPEHSALIPYLEGDSPSNGNESAEKVINALHEAGGLVVLAHPARYRQPACRVIPAAAQLGVDGLEAYYAYGNPKPWESSEPQMEEVLKLGELYGLWNTCGTDSHGESILYRL
jgi:predicted metal-dependent phosphoesterase TrpH